MADIFEIYVPVTANDIQQVETRLHVDKHGDLADAIAGQIQTYGQAITLPLQRVPMLVASQDYYGNPIKVVQAQHVATALSSVPPLNEFNQAARDYMTLLPVDWPVYVAYGGAVWEHRLMKTRHQWLQAETVFRNAGASMKQVQRMLRELGMSGKD